MSYVLKVVLSLSLILSATVQAAAGYTGNENAQAFMDEMVQEEGFDRVKLEALFAQAQRKDNILEAIARPAEKTKPWYDYRKIFVTDKRREQGLEFYEEHRETLARAQEIYGVPPGMILAIIGVETRYGRNTGSYRVIDALSTLAFDYPKRSAFFTKELRHFLILTRDQGLDPLELKGSYAGAMGYGQFMPSSYRSYAVDFDGDGLIDIWNNPVDAIGSVANYFKRHGWRAGEVVTVAAKASDDAPQDWFNDGLKPKRSVAQFAEAGITADQKVAPDAKATAMKFEGSKGDEYWLGLHNFYVITRYNHSAMYAMCVQQLSEQFAAQVGK